MQQVNYSKQIEQWLQSPWCEPEHPAILKKASVEQLTLMFDRELAFGTAGLRGIVGPGTGQLNLLTVTRLALALKRSVAGPLAQEIKQGRQGICLGFDSRLHSQFFQHTLIRLLSHLELTPIFAFKQVVPTPVLSFACRHHQTATGIMITASHNPKDYNGLKVYNDEGGQITAPWDQIILQAYLDITHEEAQALFHQLPKENFSSLQWIDETTGELYLKQTRARCLRSNLTKSQGHLVPLVYTPLHGTGLYYAKNLFTELGCSHFHVVASQAQPDGNFPTASSPNPEDPKALALAATLLEEKGAALLIGNDPDADRLGAMVADEAGKPHFLEGNNLVTLLLYYKLLTLKELRLIPKEGYVMKSIVTTQLQEKVAQFFGVQLVETLTGFKWMARVIQDREALPANDPIKNQQFLFASEESFGAMPEDLVRDKDGIAAAALLWEAAVYFKTQHQQNLLQVIEQLWMTFGFHYCPVINLQFPGINGAAEMNQFVAQFQSPEVIHWPGCPVSKIEHFDLGKTSIYEGDQRRDQPLVFEKTMMKALHFANGDRLYVRPSGTEPKLKIYLHLSEAPAPGIEGLAKSKQAVYEKYLFLKQQIDQLHAR